MQNPDLSTIVEKIPTGSFFSALNILSKYLFLN